MGGLTYQLDVHERALFSAGFSCFPFRLIFVLACIGLCASPGSNSTSRRELRLRVWLVFQALPENFGLGSHPVFAAETPGYEPSVGNRLTNKVRLHPAKTWDQGSADKFKTAGYDDLFSKKKVKNTAFLGCPLSACVVSDRAHSCSPHTRSALLDLSPSLFFL